MVKVEIDNKTYGSELYSDKEIEEIKQQFLEELWVMEIKKSPMGYKFPDGTYVKHQMKSSNDWFNSRVHNSWKKVRINRKAYDQAPLHLDEWLGEVAIATQTIVSSFKPEISIRANYNWRGILTENFSSLNILFAYVNVGLDKSMARYVRLQDEIRETTETQYLADGSSYKATIYTSIGAQSTDELVEGADGNQEPLMNLLGDEASLYFAGGNTEGSHFMQWFKKSKKRILTKKQLKFLDDMEKADHEGTTKNSYTMNDKEEITGMSASGVSRIKRNILERTLKAYEKENPLGKQTNLQLRKESELKFWNGVIDIIYCEEEMIDKQNQFFSNWIVANMTNSFLSDLVYDNLSNSDVFNVTGAMFNKNSVIEGKTLYKIVELIEARLNKLEAFDTSVVKFYRKESENNRWSLKRHQAWKRENLAFKYPDKYDYDKKKDKLIQKKPVDLGKKKLHIARRLTTSGASYDVIAMGEID
ncbi:hypothetical protein FQ085_06610 [Planococcus sp. ANT_H30]|uniref:hypothetical protein n=1 Tax=Planococcus sp. ANT_H30 TaxID=2597347 RepID=UPI0011ED9E65|nr:hypothetical protein [Planococcus sp. ANT_H30]KAA0957718.1 hypothetical protein FQ085_06610 [Planococcus sp. ANT_H30]